MSGQWKPGDVGALNHGNGEPFVFVTDKNLTWVDGSASPNAEPYTENIRPLVVIDPANDEQVKRLFDAYCTTVNRNRVDAMQAALRSLIAPPKPEEPTGLGAVVEDAEGQRWMRGSSMRGLKPWVNDDALDSEWRAYRDLAVVRILSGGVA